jgi:hypothetical protein
MKYTKTTSILSFSRLKENVSKRQVSIYSSGVAKFYGGLGASNYNGHPLREMMKFKNISIIY